MIRPATEIFEQKNEFRAKIETIAGTNESKTGKRFDRQFKGSKPLAGGAFSDDLYHVFMCVRERDALFCW